MDRLSRQTLRRHKWWTVRHRPTSAKRITNCDAAQASTASTSIGTWVSCARKPFRAQLSTIDMIFAARQVQEKCRVQNLDLYTVFVDMTKAFDTISRYGLWQTLRKIGCPDLFVDIIRLFHEGMVARVQDQGQTSEPLSVTNGTKQGCVMAPLIFTLVFSAMLYDAFHDNDLGALIRFRTDGNVFNLRWLNSKTRTLKVLIRDLLFADDCALLAHTVDDIQAITNAFARSARRFGLTISVKKTEVIYQSNQEQTTQLQPSPSTTTRWTSLTSSPTWAARYRRMHWLTTRFRHGLAKRAGRSANSPSASGANAECG